MMKLKNNNVNIKDVRREMKDLFPLIEEIILKVEGQKYIPTITSGNDSKHSENSLHYKGLAIDVRSKDMKNPKMVVKMLKKALDYELDIVLESDHIHIEYDPKFDHNI